MTGRFITLEGGEGGGKSTNLALMREVIQAAGLEVVTTREPGGTPLGEQLRALLLDHRQGAMSEDTELLLMFAARAQHLAECIQPALKRGAWVLCDRFTDATFAYQGGGRGIDASRIGALEQWVQGELRPDLTVLLDIEVDEGLRRARQTGEPDRFEREQRAFFERVRAAYLARAAAEPERFRVIDAGRELAAVTADVRATLERFIQEVRGG